MKINKYYISYFYNVRNLKPNQIPFSTALWDPKWYHDGKGKNYVFKDKRDVINGLRLEELSPWEASGCPCCDRDPTECSFLIEYKDELWTLEFDAVIDHIETTIERLQLPYDEYDAVLLVYETPDNPCSERATIKDFFLEHGIELEEFKTPKKGKTK